MLANVGFYHATVSMLNGREHFNQQRTGKVSAYNSLSFRNPETKSKVSMAHSHLHSRSTHDNDIEVRHLMRFMIC